MRSSIAISAFMAASALAAPSSPLEQRNVVYKEIVVTHTQIVTLGGEPAPTPKVVVVAPKVHHVHHHKKPAASPAPSPPPYVPAPAPAPKEEPAPAPAPTPAPEPAPAPAPAPAPQPESKPAAPASSSDNSMIDIVNKWRQAYGLGTLEWDDQLAKNAEKTGIDGGGANQNHELNPGSFAQVITPGQQTMVGNYAPTSPFELSYVAWLCEVPSSQLGGMCDKVSQNLFMKYDGTGHHDILCSQNYKKIGCGFAKNPGKSASDIYQGLYVCDLA